VHLAYVVIEAMEGPAADVTDDFVVLVQGEHPELGMHGLGPVAESGEIRAVLAAAAPRSTQVAAVAGMVRAAR
jgi:hypothetical protein